MISTTLTEPTEDDLKDLASLTDEAGFIPAGSDALGRFLVEPRDRWQGRAAAALRPRGVGGAFRRSWRAAMPGGSA